MTHGKDPTTTCIIPREVFEIAEQSIGVFFEPISKTDRHVIVQDFLDLSKSFTRADILRRYTPLNSKKLLEVGSGFGTNLLVWTKHFDVDAYGVEPGGPGFNQGHIASRILFEANGMNPDRIVNAAGEGLPFPDETFDLVYSSNVLEHTGDPERVLQEAVRVLKPGGILHIEVPNYLSYFEGHYMVFQPPIFWKPMLGWWVKFVFRRDPAFAATLQTQINPSWCRRTVRKIAQTYPLELISLGEELFLERLSKPFVFETRVVQNHIQKLIRLLQKMNVGNWIGHLIVLLQGHFPLYMTLRKNHSRT